jgi:DNA-binding NarL/FixJ family response regulator
VKVLTSEEGRLKVARKAFILSVRNSNGSGGTIQMYKMLIVEDNAMFRQSFRKVLAACFPAYTIDEAVDAAGALEKVETFQPDLVFMDIRLPGENGIRLTRKIKDAHPEIIVVIHTSYDLPEYREAAFQAGASDFITKGSLAERQIKVLVDSILSSKETANSNPDKSA